MMMPKELERRINFVPVCRRLKALRMIARRHAGKTYSKEEMLKIFGYSAKTGVKDTMLWNHDIIEAVGEDPRHLVPTKWKIKKYKTGKPKGRGCGRQPKPLLVSSITLPAAPIDSHNPGSAQNFMKVNKMKIPKWLEEKHKINYFRRLLFYPTLGMSFIYAISYSNPWFLVVLGIGILGGQLFEDSK